MNFITLSLTVVVLWALPVWSQCIPEDVISNEYLVRLKKSNATDFIQSASANFLTDALGRGLSAKPIIDVGQNLSASVTPLALSQIPPQTYLVKTHALNDLYFLQAHARVDTVEPNCKIHLTSFSTNDPMYNQQWALPQIHAPEAWDITTGSTEIIVAVSDTGVDYLHPDLKDNMWKNPNEIPNNNIDDDGNGCVDDVYGCDTAETTGDPMPPAGVEGLTHGTHVAGIIGATGNNSVGISGVNQHVRLMAVKGFNNDGSGNESALIQTIYYATNNGARVINCSWGRQGSPTQAMTDAFAYAKNHGALVVVAAGNSSMDASGFTPANLPTVVAVAASDRNDQLASFSNYGSRIDLAAPGGKGFDSMGNMIDAILSTFPTASGSYGNEIGTSMASPYVAGLAGLILSVNPNLGPDDLKSLLKSSADTVSGGYLRINAFKAVKAAVSSRGSGGGGPGGKPGSNCQAGDPYCSTASSNRLPSALQSAFKSSGSGCGLVGRINDDTNRNSPAAATLVLLLLPLIVARGLYKKT